MIGERRANAANRQLPMSHTIGTAMSIGESTMSHGIPIRVGFSGLCGRVNSRIHGAGSRRGGRLTSRPRRPSAATVRASGCQGASSVSRVWPALNVVPGGHCVAPSRSVPSRVAAIPSAGCTVAVPSRATVRVSASAGSSGSGRDNPFAPHPMTVSPRRARWILPAPGPETTRTSTMPVGRVDGVASFS